MFDALKMYSTLATGMVRISSVPKSDHSFTNLAAKNKASKFDMLYNTFSLDNMASAIRLKSQTPVKFSSTETIRIAKTKSRFSYIVRQTVELALLIWYSISER
jgi:hypothetical protein